MIGVLSMSEPLPENIIPQEFLDRNNITCSAEELHEAEQDVINGTVKSTHTRVVRCISELADHYGIERKSNVLELILAQIKEGRNFDDPYYGLAVTIEQILNERKRTEIVGSLDAIEERYGDLLLSTGIDWEESKNFGEHWREKSYNKMEYDETGKPIL